jgi:hypothetical protein
LKFLSTFSGKKLALKMLDQEIILKKLNKFHNQVCAREYQLPHVIKCINILYYNKGYLDTSKPGLGKTYVAIMVALFWGFKLLVIGPPATEDIWKHATEICGVKLIDFLSKDKLRSQRGKQPKSGYLRRDDSERSVRFQVTKKFEDLMEKKTLLVVDECHFVKNSTSAQHKATKAMLNYLVQKDGCKSRFAMLSASPVADVHHVVSFMRTMGYITSRKLCERSRNTLIYKGAKEMLNVCETMDRNLTIRLEEECSPRNAADVSRMIVVLFENIVKHHISSAAIPPKLNIQVDIKNGYYRADETTIKEFKASLKDLEIASRYERATGTADRSVLVKNNIMSKRRKTELLKVTTFARKAREHLVGSDHSKVVIGVNFIQSLELLAESLKEFSPLIVRGSVRGKDPKTGEDVRTKIYRQFNSDKNKRILIAITSVVGESISLHDTVGDAPRFIYLSSNYDLQELIQFIGRFIRDGNETKSDVVVRIVYLIGGELETAINDSLTNKEKIFKSGLIETEGLYLPSDFETYYEEEM